MAKDAYSGFIQYHGNTEEYGYMAAFGGIKSHEAEVRQVLIQMYANSQSYLKATGYLNGDELFAGLRNADVVKHAEMYYRAMYSYDEDTWNIRDIFFSDAIEAMLEHFSSFRHLENPGCCVWAHNSHCGNAAFTGASRRGQTNIGEILKKKFPDECFAIGTCTYYGSVTAANEW